MKFINDFIPPRTGDEKIDRIIDSISDQLKKIAELVNGKIGGVNIDEADVDHNQLLNYEANRHIDWTNATANFKTSGTASIGGTLIKTGAAWSKTIGAGGNYATWAAMIADMPDLIAHAATVTIKKGTTLTETCNLKNKHGLTTTAKITIQSEKYFPTSGAIPTATGATATTLVDSGQAWAVDDYIDCWVFIVHGIGTDNGFVKITDSDATSLTVASWPGTQPDNTSRYIIVGALIDGNSSRNYGVEGTNNTVQIFFMGIGIKSHVIYNFYFRFSSYVHHYYCGSYGAAYSGAFFEFLFYGSFFYSGIVGNNTNNNADNGGIGISGVNYVYITLCGISDNLQQGILARNNSFGKISNNFGDNNGAWGLYAKYSAQAFLSGTECSGSSGNHSDPGTAGTAGQDQASAYT